MANLTNIIKINETDYETLADGGSVVKDGQTYTFDENALYLVPDTSVAVEIPNDLGLSSSLLYLENDSGQIGTGINLSTLKTNLGLNNSVTSASTLTSGHVILGGGNRTISSSSYTIDTTQLSGSVYIPTSYVVQNAIDEAVNGIDLQITTTDDESLGNLTLTNGTTGVSLADINKAVVIELVGTSATSVGDHTITVTTAQYNIIKENYPNVIIELKYTPNAVMQNRSYYVYLTPKSGTFDEPTSGLALISPDYIFEGGKVQIGEINSPTVCNVSLLISGPLLPTQSPSATLTMSKVQTTKYQHNLRFYYQQTISGSSTKYVPTNFTTTIINDSSTAFNASTLLSYLETNGLTSSTKCLSISGIHRTSSGIAYILSGLSRASSTNAQVHGMNVAQLENASQSLPISSVTITLTNGYLYDTVVEI